MRRCVIRSLMAVAFLLVGVSALEAQEGAGWYIAPRRINIGIGEDRVLQILDQTAQELRGATWSIDSPDKAQLREEDGREVLHAKAAGTVTVYAALNGEQHSLEIRVWPTALPQGTTQWGMDPIGRELGDLPAVPGDGPTTYSLEQTSDGRTFLRAVRHDGIQVWNWELPEKTHDVELICGDWTGGALIGANLGSSFTLYTVGKDGKERWRHTFKGVRKGHAYNLNHLVHVISQSTDATSVTLTGLDEITGAQRFQLDLPSSKETSVNVRRSGASTSCASASQSSTLPIVISKIIVNSDGLAYLAFTQRERSLKSGPCTPGLSLSSHEVNLTRDDRVILWQIHPDGRYRSTIIEQLRDTHTMSEALPVVSPTGSVIPDGFGGLLVSMREEQSGQDELVYRLDGQGGVVYRFPLPRYTGTLHDDMVLGEDNTGFATRGARVVCFSVQDGTELWHWDSDIDDISLVAALANGHVLVQTPTNLLEVGGNGHSRVLANGKAMLGWQGQMWIKHN